MRLCLLGLAESRCEQVCAPPDAKRCAADSRRAHRAVSWHLRLGKSVNGGVQRARERHHGRHA